MNSSKWHPRGEPTWPDWKKAVPGTRVEHVRSGRRGTLARVVDGRTAGNRYAVVDWDGGYSVTGHTYRGRVVAPAFDLRPIDGEADA